MMAKVFADGFEAHAAMHVLLYVYHIFLSMLTCSEAVQEIDKMISANTSAAVCRHIITLHAVYHA